MSSVDSPSQNPPVIASPTPRRYSDVVAARSVSAPPDAEANRAGGLALEQDTVEGRDSAIGRVAVTTGRDSASQRAADGRREIPDHEGPQSAASQYDEGWNEVGKNGKPCKRKRAQRDSSTSSRDSLLTKPVSEAPNVLSATQIKDVDSAVASMDATQLDKYSQRFKHLKLNKADISSEDTDSRTPSPVQGPSQHKGKTAD
jgi:hypothetical protein